jgi:excinuclease ABC subunit B
MNETNRRREKQITYNVMNNISPAQIIKSTHEILRQTTVADGKSRVPAAYIEKDYADIAADPVFQYLTKEKLQKLISRNRKDMENAVKSLDFLEAARLRDEMKVLSERLDKLAIQNNQPAGNSK